MPQNLYESENLTFNLSTLGTIPAEVTNEVSNTSSAKEGSISANVNKRMPEKYNWGWWKAELNKRLEENKKAASDKRRPETEIEQGFFKDFFEVNWVETSASKLIAIDKPLRDIIKALGFDPTRNPILAFMRQGYVQKHLLQPGLLNANTFRAIYNALVTKQVAGSEFLKENNYNIIYCRDLYSKSASEMSKYLDLQKLILNPSASEGNGYNTLKNRKTFFYIDIKLKNKDQNPVHKIAQLPKISEDRVPNATDINTKLNSLAFVKEACRVSDMDPTTNLSSEKQDELVKYLQTPAIKYAAILALALTTDSSEAKETLSKDIFGTLPADEVLKATKTLASKDIMPKGKLNKTDADALVAKIVASIA